ncbi:flagellar biosynthesis protein FlhF [Tepidimicrobium xylanilyticum]|uniref:flagellar biosynthesis protein FlhF n=1 Tax=Tepidimicrobium xylanilyticum TaxID=1123352 RepID=UPI00264F33F7|nr:flagellar biosynthesis protein FlhF [Tepidimicrobium xylanilyticum]GMG97121.1 flagellar biosynthesis regulator FlhF [Tepidimicrobium xylanilyticum]
MKIKRYVGYTTHEAMSKLKKDLGSEAVILSTRTIKQKGLFGFLKKPMVEITAAYEKKDLNSELFDEKLKKINSELYILKNMVLQITSEANIKPPALPKELDNFKTKLIENGVDYKIATTILERLNKQININDKSDNTIKSILKETLMEYIGLIEPLNMDDLNQKFIFFLGPTGVGKTTTLAKIAAKLVMEGKYNIGLITTDTYRVAAVEQLKVYSDILQLPLKVIYSEEDMYKSLVNFRDKDVLLVDTAGRNHKEIKDDDIIFKLINSIKNKEIFLVLSCTTEYGVLKSIIEQYSFIPDYKIIFTKVDECENFGNILNAKLLTNKPLSYITTGQNVPDDIEILNREKIANSLIGEI